MRELSENLKIPKASVFRVLRTLEKRGYVYSPSKGAFALGVKLISLGSGVLDQSDLKKVAIPYMFELAEKTNQTVQLGVLFHYEVMYIDQIKTSKFLNVIVHTGTPFPVNLSAGGKVLVAHLPQEKSKDFLRHAKLKANTRKTVVDRAAFRKVLQKVKLDGYSLDDEEFARGIRCIAVLIFNQRGQNIASLGITGHTSEITDEKFPIFTKDTIEVANQISLALLECVNLIVVEVLTKARTGYE